MLKETGYQDKIIMITPWFDEIIDIVKKDLKNEHLKIDKVFCKKYFLGKNPIHVQANEMATAYLADITSGNVGLAEFIATRWLLKNTDIYAYFEEKIKKFSADFEMLDELPHELSVSLMHQAVKLFGAKKTYLFSVFNSVVFPKDIYAQLKELAEIETKDSKIKEENEKNDETIELMQQRFNREIKAMNDRHEKKMSGMQKKYLQDTESLKKQISNLQKKLNNDGR